VNKKRMKLKQWFLEMQFNVHLIRYEDKSATWIGAWFDAVLDEVIHQWSCMLCSLHGHEVVNDGYSVENGTEDMYCTRCGSTWHVQW
jgi:hypothetical protein